MVFVTEILTIFVYKCLLNDLHDLVWETNFAAEMAFRELWEQYQRPKRDWNKAIHSLYKMTVCNWCWEEKVKKKNYLKPNL